MRNGRLRRLPVLLLPMTAATGLATANARGDENTLEILLADVLYGDQGAVTRCRTASPG